jgi:GTP-binding protein
MAFDMFDTAGLEEGEPGSLFNKMRVQTNAALDESDVALMIIDARAGVTPLDKHFTDWIRRQNVEVILVANKCESNVGQSGTYEAFSLGLGQPIPLSAEHGEGLTDLYDAIREAVEKQGLETRPPKRKEKGPAHDEKYDLTEGDFDYEFEEEEVIGDGKPLMLAIVGRPNAGKSTLINHLVGEERLITGPEAGLTRDSVSLDWSFDNKPIRLFDTAGLRKKANVIGKLEKLSVADALRAVQFAEVVVLLIDAELGVEKQDLKIASLVVQEGRGLVVAINKWDLVKDRITTQRQVQDVLGRSLPQLKGVKVINFSALTGQGTQKLMPSVLDVYDLWNSRISTSILNEWLFATLDKHPPPMVRGRRIKMRFMAQVKARPPTFVIFTNRPADVPDSYMRYMENELRRDFDLPGTPIRFLHRKGENPYHKSRRRK